MMAGRIIGRLQHESERYQSRMKFIFASLIVAFLTISATGKDRPCIFRGHAAANPTDIPSFSSLVRASLSGNEVVIADIDLMKKDRRMIGLKKK